MRPSPGTRYNQRMNAPTTPLLPQTSLNIAPFARRRAALLAHMRAHGGGIALIPTAPERARNRDTHFSYRHDSYFYYLSGFTEPEAWLLLIASGRDASERDRARCGA
jgi:Xaa-Pro aminopeptidase